MMESNKITTEEIEFDLNRSIDSNDRLHFFVKCFVNELEATLTYHYKILFGELKKVGEIEKVLGNVLGSGMKFLGVSGLDNLLKKVLSMPFEEYYKTKSYKYFEIVYNFHKYKSQGRSLFVRIAIEVFQSFELQFMEVTGERTYHEAMKNLATDAAQRFLNYTKADGESSSASEDLPAKRLEAQNVVFGKSKEEFFDKLKIEKRTLQIKSKNIPCLKRKKPGFEFLRGNEIWNTASLYEKSGIVKNDRDGIKLYARKQSKYDKYSFRRPFNEESWEQEYNISVKDANFKADYSLDCDHYKLQHAEILRKINVQDGAFVQRRSLELIEELYIILSDGLESVTNETRKHYEDAIEILHDEFRSIRNHFEEVNRNIKDVKNVVLDLEKTIKQSQTAEKKKVIFGLTNPVKYFTGRREHLENIHKTLTESKKTTIISNAVSIMGLGGVGKTELAVKYANDYIDYYDSIVFINSEKKENIERCFKSLAQKIDIPVTDEKTKGDPSSQQEINIQDIVQNIYRHFNDTKLLIIFDNVEDYCFIKDFIYRANSSGNKISTLITSRNRDWDVGGHGEIGLISLERFCEDEALDFVQNNLGKETEEDVKRLIKTLDSLPLAMKQAIGYIRQQIEKNSLRGLTKFTVKKYLELYEKENHLLLDRGHNLTDDVYNETVATTWMITIKMIEENAQCGNLALDIFHTLAYLSPEDIHVEELFSDLATDDETMWDAVKLLHKYSMIHLDKGIVHIHRLVQQVTQNHLKIAGEEEKVLRQALELLNGSNFEDHAVSVWEHSCQYSELIDDFYCISEYGRWKSPLELLSAYRNDCKAIERLYQSSNKDIRQAFILDSSKFDPLNIAAENGNINVVKFLFEKVENLGTCLLSTPRLRLAAINGHFEVVKFVQNKIKALQYDYEIGVNLLDEVSINGHINIIEILKPNDNEVHLFYATLMSAFLKGNYDVCKSMIESSPNILKYKFGDEDNSILHIIAGKGNIEIVESLLVCIDVNICNSRNETPAHFAAGAGNDDVLILLLKRGANYNAVNFFGKTLLHFAASACNVETLKMLIEKGLDCLEADKFKRFPIYYAVIGNNNSAVQFLIENGMEIENKTALLDKMFTVRLHKETISLLLELGADINTVDEYGYTSLSYASLYNGYDVVKTLLEAGADPDFCDFDSPQSALHLAASRNNLRIVKLLLKRGADPNILDKSGNTALHVAALYWGKLPVVEMLVRYGCDIRFVNKNGKTPLDLAALKRKEAICDYLKKRMDVAHFELRSIHFYSFVLIMIVIYNSLNKIVDVLCACFS
ncbi:uncharacterized protein LOC143923146 [Arctopsyche grandis]|uniref:uncharacterized protein LOC143923146 n=1 Tax=Arctopsyche grandis TaxID=121162 RepID=UPI00406D84B2